MLRLCVWHRCVLVYCSSSSNEMSATLFYTTLLVVLLLCRISSHHSCVIYTDLHICLVQMWLIMPVSPGTLFIVKNQPNKLMSRQMKEGDGSIKNLGCSMVGSINKYIYLCSFFSFKTNTLPSRVILIYVRTAYSEERDFELVSGHSA